MDGLISFGPLARLSRKWLSPFLLAIPALSMASPGDTLIFKSRFEQRVFEDIRQKRKVDDLLLFTIFDGDSDAYIFGRTRLENFYSNILTPKLKSRNEKVRAKVIFDEVHGFFLAKYEDPISFSSIFKNGYYNCVSGSALYSLVLEHYRIPYEIRETPTHVYVITYPGTHHIMFESTNPRGYFAIDAKAKEHAVNALVLRKFLTQNYVRSVGATKAYNDFFYATDPIDIPRLAGIQYWNGALEEMQASHYKGALRMIEKSDVLFPAKKNGFLRQELLENILANSKFDSLEDILYLAEFTNASNTEKSRKQAESTFQSILEKYLIQKSNEAYAHRVYDQMVHRLADPDFAKEIRAIYNFQFCRYYLLKSKYDSALRYGNDAFKDSPDDASVQECITTAIVQKVFTTTGSPSSVDVLNDFCVQYPFLQTNAKIRAMYIFNYARLAYFNFQGNREKEGFRYLDRMEQELASSEASVIRDENLIGLVYAEAGSYFYRIHSYKKALDIMQKGFMYAPDHPEIKVRMEIVRDEMKSLRK